MYNVEPWVEKTIRSVLSQTYQNYQCMIVDDCSTDHSAAIVESLIKNDHRFNLIKNTTKKTIIENRVFGIKMSNPNNDDIIITVDGDDWLAHEHVLDRVKQAYDTSQCMITYGSYEEYPSGETSHSWMQELPDIIKMCGLYRHYQWQLSHLRTFKYALFSHIKHSDFKDDNGNYFNSATDLAFMFPLSELAHGNITFIPDILYIYNRETALNIDKINLPYQIECDMAIRRKQPYNALSMIDYPPLKQPLPIEKLHGFIFHDLRSKPAISQLYSELGAILFYKERYHDAILYFEESLSYDYLERSYKYLIQSYLSLNQFKKATEIYKQANQNLHHPLPNMNALLEIK